MFSPRLPLTVVSAPPALIAQEKGYQKPVSQDRLVAIPKLQVSPCVLTMDECDVAESSGSTSDSDEPHASSSKSSAVLTCIFDGHAGTCAAETAAFRLSQLVAEDHEIWSRMSESDRHSVQCWATAPLSCLPAGVVQLVAQVECMSTCRGCETFHS